MPSLPDARVHPGAVVVHVEDAGAAGNAVVCTLGLEVPALGAVLYIGRHPTQVRVLIDLAVHGTQGST